ncbi:hypothetical protein RHMOL_Rhmol04G0220200 [Rhododendron molle]|uniref:Uncharacterized protein n=1 Tax=Rhododendron molle TaxID=49168 RepID=A0ACC0P373_RHOML|nr:hypothetical protein RHMOL_Rhmol04G0220200 [Rhododendron molle]
MMAVGWNMEDKADEWKELSKGWIEQYNMGFPPFPHVDQVWLDHWEGEWNAAQADPLDGPLFMLFHQFESVNPEGEAEEYIWEPQTNAG